MGFELGHSRGHPGIGGLSLRLCAEECVSLSLAELPPTGATSAKDAKDDLRDIISERFFVLRNLRFSFLLIPRPGLLPVPGSGSGSGSGSGAAEFVGLLRVFLLMMAMSLKGSVCLLPHSASLSIPDSRSGSGSGEFEFEFGALLRAYFRVAMSLMG